MGRLRGDIGEIWGHPGGDEREGDGDADARPDAADVPWEIWGDMGEIWGRYRGDIGEITCDAAEDVLLLEAETVEEQPDLVRVRVRVRARVRVKG